MVLGRKMTLQNVPSRGRLSIMKIQNFTTKKRQSMHRVGFGVLLILTSLITILIGPIELFTEWFMDLRPGSFVLHMWEDPTYKVYSEVTIFNYTNVEQFLNGETKVLKLEEVGPFKFEEVRINQDIQVDKKNGVMRVSPNVSLRFIKEESIAELKDVNLFVPNMALIALNTMAADHVGYLANVGAYYSITALGSKLFRPLTAQEYLWGYYDPIVTLASRVLPGWIDFGKIGIMDRFYAQEPVVVEMELKNVTRKFSINSWDGQEGIVEQGFTDLNTSTNCNRIKGSYEGLVVPPNTKPEGVLPVFKKQACRIYPFAFQKEMYGNYGFRYLRFVMERNAFNKNSSYACECKEHCLPDGFIDISSCFYGFPIALSKPHFLDVDPEQRAYFEGMNPDPAKQLSHIDVEPNLGIHIAMRTNTQVNIAVRTNPGNPITRPLKDRMLPLIWFTMYCKSPPPEVVTLLRLRFVIAPPLLITVEILLFIVGMILGIQGFYRILRPKYKLIQYNHDLEEDEPKTTRRKSSLIINVEDNIGFKEDADDTLAKEAVSLLSIREEDGDLPDLLVSES